LVNSTIQIVDDYLRNSTVNISELHDLIKKYAGKSVYGLTISGLGGSENYRMLVVEDKHSTMCVKKTLSVQADGTTIIVENVNVKFNVIG
jgi:predicted transcriptional regulator